MEICWLLCGCIYSTGEGRGVVCISCLSLVLAAPAHGAWLPRRAAARAQRPDALSLTQQLDHLQAPRPPRSWLWQMPSAVSAGNFPPTDSVISPCCKTTRVTPPPECICARVACIRRVPHTGVTLPEQLLLLDPPSWPEPQDSRGQRPGQPFAPCRCPAQSRLMTRLQTVCRHQ